MQKHIRSDRFALLMACGVWLIGLFFIARGIAHAFTASKERPSLGILALDSLIAMLAVGLVGLLMGLLVEVMRKVLLFLDLAVARELGEAGGHRWDRILRAIESVATSSANGLVRHDLSANGSRSAVIDAIDHAIRDEEWMEADRLLEELRIDDPSNSEIDRLAGKLESARQETTESHLDQLKVSREVNDTERVLELFEKVSPLLDSSRRKALEDELAGWFMTVIQRRLRSGTIQPDVVTLTARVSEVFGGTVEGASLRAGLGTLRRAVGLCPQCGGPYVGVAKSCPGCEATASS